MKKEQLLNAVAEILKLGQANRDLKTRIAQVEKEKIDNEERVQELDTENEEIRKILNEIYPTFAGLACRSDIKKDQEYQDAVRKLYGLINREW